MNGSSDRIRNVSIIFENGKGKQNEIVAESATDDFDADADMPSKVSSAPAIISFKIPNSPTSTSRSTPADPPDPSGISDLSDLPDPFDTSDTSDTPDPSHQKSDDRGSQGSGAILKSDIGSVKTSSRSSLASSPDSPRASPLISLSPPSPAVPAPGGNKREKTGGKKSVGKHTVLEDIGEHPKKNEHQDNSNATSLKEIKFVDEKGKLDENPTHKTKDTRGGLRKERKSKGTGKDTKDTTDVNKDYDLKTQNDDSKSKVKLKEKTKVVLVQEKEEKEKDRQKEREQKPKCDKEEILKDTRTGHDEEDTGRKRQKRRVSSSHHKLSNNRSLSKTNTDTEIVSHLRIMERTKEKAERKEKKDSQGPEEGKRATHHRQHTLPHKHNKHKDIEKEKEKEKKEKSRLPSQNGDPKPTIVEESSKKRGGRVQTKGKEEKHMKEKGREPSTKVKHIDVHKEVPESGKKEKENREKKGKARPESYNVEKEVTNTSPKKRKDSKKFTEKNQPSTQWGDHTTPENRSGEDKPHGQDSLSLSNSFESKGPEGEEDKQPDKALISLSSLWSFTKSRTRTTLSQKPRALSIPPSPIKMYNKRRSVRSYSHPEKRHNSSPSFQQTQDGNSATSSLRKSHSTASESESETSRTVPATKNQSS
jgi:hypothetical protein